jgi:hypothetical protein
VRRRPASALVGSGTALAARGDRGEACNFPTAKTPSAPSRLETIIDRRYSFPGDVGLHGPIADAELRDDFLPEQTLDEKVEHIVFAGREPGRATNSLSGGPGDPRTGWESRLSPAQGIR